MNTAATAPGHSALLYSGGLDSVAAAWLLPHAVPVYVTLGHPYEAAELRTARQLAPHLHVLAGPPVGRLQEPDGHIRHRNALLVTVAAAHGYRTIYMGAVRGEASPDKSPAFFRRMTQLLATSEAERHAVQAPFAHLTKSQLLRQALAAGMPHQRALASRSCYSPAGACGQCQACFRRWVALVHAGLPAGPRPATPPANAWRHLRRAGVRRWWDVAVNNMEALWARLKA